MDSVEFNLFILLVIILAGPIIAERLRIPALIGLIAGGMAVGPFVLDWISTDSLLSEFGDVGLLFLMFLA
ncbi:MAG: cation:proton antiporter, partial [Acidimicrobiia bacterium]|nr:cation:proton antiporter [Acidimicrobiia bacterium]